MDRDTNETPMEFEWQNGGPVDVNSPFHQRNVERFVAMQNQRERSALKRTCSVFDSPDKKTVPPLREPASQPFLFNSPPRPLSALPASFTTPRNIDLDFSSGPEPASSPDNADADTPEPFSISRPKQPTFPPAKDTPLNPPNFFSKFKKSTSPAKPSPAPFSNAITRKVRKRRQAEKGALTRYNNGSDGEADNTSWGGRAHGKNHSGAPSPFLDRIFAALEMHPHIPMILSQWAYLMLNVFLVSSCVGIVWLVWSAIQNEVGMASTEAESELLADMAECSRHFVQNNCDAKNRVPAVEKLCEGWSRCMSRDPLAVGRATVSATTFARIFNSFVEPISWKAVAVVVLGIGSFVAINNLTFGQARRTQNNNFPPPYPHYSNVHASPGYAFEMAPHRYDHSSPKRQNLGNGEWDRPAPKRITGFS